MRRSSPAAASPPTRTPSPRLPVPGLQAVRADHRLLGGRAARSPRGAARPQLGVAPVLHTPGRLHAAAAQDPIHGQALWKIARGSLPRWTSSKSSTASQAAARTRCRSARPSRCGRPDPTAALLASAHLSSIKWLTREPCSGACRGCRGSRSRSCVGLWSKGSRCSAAPLQVPACPIVGAIVARRPRRRGALSRTCGAGRSASCAERRRAV